MSKHVVDVRRPLAFDCSCFLSPSTIESRRPTSPSPVRFQSLWLACHQPKLLVFSALACPRLACPSLGLLDLSLSAVGLVCSCRTCMPLRRCCVILAKFLRNSWSHCACPATLRTTLRPSCLFRLLAFVVTLARSRSPVAPARARLSRSCSYTSTYSSSLFAFVHCDSRSRLL